VAVAELYPKFKLSGSIGLEALALVNLFSTDSQTSGGGALVNWPIFKGGAIRKNIEVQSAIQEQYLQSLLAKAAYADFSDPKISVES
jgi:outer membrane protein TolC